MLKIVVGMGMTGAGTVGMGTSICPRAALYGMHYGLAYTVTFLEHLAK